MGQLWEWHGLYSSTHSTRYTCKRTHGAAVLQMGCDYEELMSKGPLQRDHGWPRGCGKGIMIGKGIMVGQGAVAKVWALVKGPWQRGCGNGLGRGEGTLAQGPWQRGCGNGLGRGEGTSAKGPWQRGCGNGLGRGFEEPVHTGKARAFSEVRSSRGLRGLLLTSAYSPVNTCAKSWCDDLCVTLIHPSASCQLQCGMPMTVQHASYGAACQ